MKNNCGTVKGNEAKRVQPFQQLPHIIFEIPNISIASSIFDMVTSYTDTVEGHEQTNWAILSLPGASIDGVMGVLT